MNMVNGFTRKFLSLKTSIKENGLQACLQITAGQYNEMILRRNTKDKDLINEETCASASHLRLHFTAFKVFSSVMYCDSLTSARFAPCIYHVKLRTLLVELV